MTALTIALGAMAHLILLMGLNGAYGKSANTDSQLAAVFLVPLGFFGAAYFWARMAGFP